MNAEIRVGWRVGDGWAGKVSAISAILGPYNAEVFGVSEAEPLPDELLTVAQCLLMPADDLTKLLGGGGGDDDDGGDSGGGCGGGGCSGGGDGTGPRVPLEHDQSFARLVGVALRTAVDAALARYVQPREAVLPGEGPGEEVLARSARRRAAAATIVEGEMRALRATRRAASELMGAGGEAALGGGGVGPPSRSGSDDDDASDGEAADNAMRPLRKRRRRAPPPRVLFADDDVHAPNAAE